MTNTTAREHISASLENLPSPPFVAVEVLRITNDPEASVQELARGHLATTRYWPPAC